jgi:hypothetical protein
VEWGHEIETFLLSEYKEKCVFHRHLSLYIVLNYIYIYIYEHASGLNISDGGHWSAWGLLSHLKTKNIFIKLLNILGKLIGTHL